MPKATKPKRNKTKQRLIPVRLDLVRSDLYRMARDENLRHHLRIAAAKALLQYAETGMSDAAAADHIEKLYGALSAKAE